MEGFDEEGRVLCAGTGESWEASEQGSDMVRTLVWERSICLWEHNSEVSPSPFSHTWRPWCPLEPSGPRPRSGLFQGPPRALPSLAFIPPDPPHLTAKSTLLPFKGWICCRPGPGVRSPTWHVAKLRAGLSPELPAVTYSLSTVLRCQGCRCHPLTGSPWVTACQRKGPDCGVTPFGIPDTIWGSPALLRVTSRTLWWGQALSNPDASVHISIK